MKKKLDKMFKKASSELDNQKLIEFLSYSYGAMSSFVPDYTIGLIENELNSQLERNKDE